MSLVLSPEFLTQQGQTQVIRSRMHAREVTSVMSDSLWPYGLYPPRFLCLWSSSGKNTGVGCHAILQGIFPTLGLNPRLLRLLHGRQILYCWATREVPCSGYISNINSLLLPATHHNVPNLLFSQFLRCFHLFLTQSLWTYGSLCLEYPPPPCSPG